jgi:hypothetical protein
MVRAFRKEGPDLLFSSAQADDRKAPREIRRASLSPKDIRRNISFRRLLAGCDSAHRAYARASSAVYADIGIDGVNITLFNRSGRAFALAGAACNAVGLRNLVSHFNYPFKCYCCLSCLFLPGKDMQKYLILFRKSRFGLIFATTGP